MQKRTMIFLGLLAIFAIVIAGSASAFDLSSLLGGDSDESATEQVTIAGIDFNIPEGYKEVPDYSFENETSYIGSVSYTINGKSFENDAKDAIAILIADYGDFNVTDEVLQEVADEPKTIKNYDGYVKQDGNFTVFAYEEDGDLVTITASDDKIIEEVLV